MEAFAGGDVLEADDHTVFEVSERDGGEVGGLVVGGVYNPPNVVLVAVGVESDLLFWIKTQSVNDSTRNIVSISRTYGGCQRGRRGHENADILPGC